MRRILTGAVVALTSLALAASVTAANNQGIHGAAIARFPELAFGGTWRLTVNATRLPTGAVSGEVSFTGVDLPLADYSAAWADPVYLETAGDTGCVVADVKRSRGEWQFGPPARIVVGIRDVADGPDLFGPVLHFNTAADPAILCSNAFPAFAVSEGNFAIRP